MTDCLKEYLYLMILSNTFLQKNTNITNSYNELKNTGNINKELLNILTQKEPTGKIGSNQFAFICGKKYTESMIQQLYNGKVKVLSEFSIPYTKELLKNIKHQYPKSFVEPFTDIHGINQNYIFGYLVICDNIMKEIGLESSYFFTNKNTFDFFSKHTNELPEENIKIIKNMIEKIQDTYQSCIVGSAAIKLFNKNTCASFLSTEVLNRKNNNINLILKKINNTKIIKIVNKKVEWFEKCYFIPSHDIYVNSKSDINISNFFTREEIFCYYKGIKFLYIGGDNSNITIKKHSEYNNICNTKKKYIPNKKNRVNETWNPFKSYKADIYTCHNLKDLQIVDKCFWILLNDGTFTIIISEQMYIPWLSHGFIATGIIEKRYNKFMLYPANKFSSDNDTLNYISLHLKKHHIENIVLSGFDENNKINTCRTKKVNMKNNMKKIIKKQKFIIQNEQKRNSISTFFTLLPGN